MLGENLIPDSRSDWIKLQPYSMILIWQLFSSKKGKCFVRITYPLLCLVSVAASIFILWKAFLAKKSPQTICFELFKFIYSIFFYMLPPFALDALRKSLESSDLTLISKEVMSMDEHSSLPTLIYVMSTFNLLSSILASAIFSAYYIDFTWIFAVWMVGFVIIFIIPSCLLLIYCIIIIYLHSCQVSSFLAHIRSLSDQLDRDICQMRSPQNESDNTSFEDSSQPIPIAFPTQSALSNDQPLYELSDMNLDPKKHVPNLLYIYRQYTHIHRQCRHSSVERGRVVLLSLCNLILLTMCTIWGVYVQDFSPISILPYTVISIFCFCQLALPLVRLNEMGNLVTREACSYILLLKTSRICPLSSADVMDMDLFLQACQVAKIEIVFFGAFALRTAFLLGVLGSIIAAIIPQFILTA
jgi:hypothetical protein